ncbi:MAG: hypothetical protein LBM59_02805 [Ruminococcus sp.]|jgi:hypothetical protein|nr:hypothetical protein [Ruminococcus sp.]
MKRKKSAGILVRVLIIIVLAVLIGGVLIFNFFFKTDGTPSSVFGIYFLRTNEVYMETEIMPGDMVIALETDPADIKPQDAVIAKFDERITIIRVIDVIPGETAPTFLVKYDTVDESKAFNIDADKIVAVAKYKDPIMGQLLGVATSVPGIIIAVIIPLTLIIIYQIARFARERSDEEEDEKPERERTEELTEIMSERPLEQGSMRLSGFTAELEKMNAPEKPRTERKLMVDERGRAGIAETIRTDNTTSDATRQIAIGAYTKNTPPPEPQSKTSNPYGDKPRFASRIGYPDEKNNTPVLFIPPEEQNAELKKTRIDDLVRDNERADNAARSILRPKPASVIPEEVTRLQQNAPQTPNRTGFEDTVREYYSARTPATPEESGFAEPAATIPEGAVVPKERIAPVRRKKQSSTVDELMKLIDDQTTKKR